jgi:predicted lipid carrier protein YhbT
MQITAQSTRSTPLLPAPFSLPLRMIPAFVHDRALVTALNRVFSKELREGELDFLRDRVIRIAIEDAGIEYAFTLTGNRLEPGDNRRVPDLLLNGTVYDYLLLASRREDADTLFFNRRLQIQGDTELGLYVKNFLDSLDLDSNALPLYLQAFIQKSLPWYERFFKAG